MYGRRNLRAGRVSAVGASRGDEVRRYGGHGHRWVNVLTVSAHSSAVATVLPFNTEDPRWPRLGMGGEYLSPPDKVLPTRRAKAAERAVADALAEAEEAWIGSAA